jgi:hypothetical protein
MKLLRQQFIWPISAKHRLRDASARIKLVHLNGQKPIGYSIRNKTIVIYYEE